MVVNDLPGLAIQDLHTLRGGVSLNNSNKLLVEAAGIEPASENLQTRGLHAYSEFCISSEQTPSEKVLTRPA